MAKRFKNAKMQEMYLKAVERSEEQVTPNRHGSNFKLYSTEGNAYVTLQAFSLRVRVVHTYDDNTSRTSEKVTWAFQGYSISAKKAEWLLDEAERQKHAEPTVR